MVVLILIIECTNEWAFIIPEDFFKHWTTYCILYVNINFIDIYEHIYNFLFFLNIFYNIVGQFQYCFVFLDLFNDFMFSRN
jgi:hypothetical protein